MRVSQCVVRASRCWLAVFAIFVLAAVAPRIVVAENAFFDIPLADLKITAGEMPKPGSQFRYDPRWNAIVPAATLDGEGEAYLDVPDQSFWNFQTLQNDFSAAHLLIRAPAGKEVSGRMGVPKADMSGMNLIKFVVPTAAAKPSAEEQFYLAKAHHYVELAQRRDAGAAWFRHEVLQADQKLKQLDPKKHPSGSSAIPGGWIMPPEPTEAYDLFSGGRAISESLQLDRQLREREQAGKADIDIKTLTGITIDKIDWKPLLKDAQPKLDPLAKLIPADQHVVFFPSFADVMKLSDESGNSGELLFKLAEPRSEDAGVRARYERQLGLSLSDLGRIVGQATINSVALTGSDPYFPTGTDVAVLFQTDHPDVLAGLLKAKIGLASAKESEVKPQSGEAGGLKYEGFRSPDRAVCSYIAQLDGAVVVTNSPAQLERLAKVGKQADSIATLDEYKFFRMRYPLGDKDETAFLFISDPTIRRWCSPQWRIAAARRTFTAGVLAELTADNMPALVSGKAETKTLHTDLALIDAGALTLSKSGVDSSTQGSLEFATPIVELPIEKVTKAEADAYNQWRDAYQENWSWRFDPIALRVGVVERKLSGDLTVMPLILGSEYREFISISRGAEIKPEAGDRHDDLAHFALAINTKSDTMRRWGNMASAFTPQAHIDALGWLGSSVALYVDDSPLWGKLREMSPEEREKELEKDWGQLPIALQAEVSSPLKLAGFLAAVRAFIEQTAPGMTAWESLTYKEQPYVRVKATENGRKNLGSDANVAVYYAPTADCLIVSLNEDVLKHALDRRLARQAADKSGDPSGGKPEGKAGGGKTSGANRAADTTGETNMADLPWLGANLCVHTERKMFEILSRAGRGGELEFDSFSDTALQVRSWSNLPILNEWKRLFPNEDPVKVHERVWHTKLVCPGGGQYVWNDEWKTMESTVYGHPGQPKSGPSITAALGRFESANFGLTFEEQGLRGRLELNRAAKEAAK